MSFNDFDRTGTPSRQPPREFTGLDFTSPISPPSLSPPPQDSAEVLEYHELTERIPQLVYKVSTNISTIDRLVALLGTLNDTQQNRDLLHDITEATRSIVKTINDHIKNLTVYVNEPGADKRQRKMEQQKLSRDFQRVLEQFQVAQRRSIEKTRQCVAISKAHAMRNDQYDDEEDGNPESRPLIPEQRLQLQVLDNEIDYNETIIEERENEINGISQGIAELNGIFNELARIVGQQGSMLDNIEVNVSNITSNVRNAADELTTANRYQKSSRKWLCTILLVTCGIGMVITLIAYLS